MAFLRNPTVNLVNLHYAIRALAGGMGGVFVLVFLLHAGVSIAQSLCAMALIFAGRFCIRPLILPLAKHWGMKPLVVIGSLVIAAEFPILASVHGVDWPLLAFCFVASLGDTLYWTSYHAYFASLGDAEHRGHQISAREAISAVVGIIAPLIGAWALVTFGPSIAFAAVCIVQTLSAIPLFATPNVIVARAMPGAYRAALTGVLLFAADGWFAAMYVFVWQIALFRSLGDSFSAYGGAMAFAALVGAVSGMLIGRHIDEGHGGRAVLIAYSVVGAVLLLRVMSPGMPWLAVGANALGALAGCLQVPAMMTAVYNLAKASPCSLRFHVAAEGGWDIGSTSGCLVAAALAGAGLPLGAIIALGFLALVAQATLLRGYYSQRAIVA